LSNIDKYNSIVEIWLKKNILGYRDDRTSISQMILKEKIKEFLS